MIGVVMRSPVPNRKERKLRKNWKKRWEITIRKHAVKSVLIRSFVVFIIELIISTVFCMTRALGFGSHHYVIVAMTVGVGVASVSKIIGMGIGTEFVLFGLISTSNDKLGMTRLDKIITSISYIVATLLAAFGGCALASGLTGIPPVLITWTGSPSEWFRPAITEFTFMVFYLLIVGMIMDYEWSSEETVCLRKPYSHHKDGGKRKYQELRRYLLPRSDIAVIFFGARWVLSETARLLSGGVLSFDIGVMGNVLVAIWTADGFPLLMALFYLITTLLAVLTAGILYGIIRYFGRRTILSRRMAGRT